MHCAGRLAEAETLFADAETRQQKNRPTFPLLSSLQGYQYCNLLLGRGEWVAARDRADKTIVIARETHWLLDIALDTLTLGRASLGLAFEVARSMQPGSNARNDVRTARARLDEAVEGLRGAGASEHIPRGLLGRAVFHRGFGDWDSAGRDLEEVEEIAEQGPMKLFLYDMALERARPAFAQIEAFAPLNGLLEANPPKPTIPDADEANRLVDEAKQNLDTARELIESCGYHRRDEELAELEAVLGGEKHFADLPPRV